MKKITIPILIIIFVIFVSHHLTAKENINKIEIIYFHATIRCHTCLTIEDFINKSVRMFYEKELKDSIITLSSIDFLQPENEHYQDKYKFDTQTLIISKKVEGKEINWKNLDKIWDYSNDFEKFRKYILKEINLFRRLE
ncbi:MAG: nitrophenyl compound nitroreductase subunit ArsF family protein [Bacteroidetes bacterium]|nr:nitrophenyl compound nitroreductase subunit ArsF family protein [Bacteroidota bacterium]